NLNRLEQEKMLLKEDVASERKEVPHPERAHLEEQERRFSEQLADLRSRYSDEYPDVADTNDRLMQVRKQLESLPDRAAQPPERVATAPAPHNGNSARWQINNNEIARLQSEQQQILAQIKEYQAKVEAVPLREQELSELGRDYRNSTVRYQSVL